MFTRLVFYCFLFHFSGGRVITHVCVWCQFRWVVRVEHSGTAVTCGRASMSTRPDAARCRDGHPGRVPFGLLMAGYGVGAKQQQRVLNFVFRERSRWQVVFARREGTMGDITMEDSFGAMKDETDEGGEGGRAASEPAEAKQDADEEAKE